jgi:hypothetical protein
VWLKRRCNRAYIVGYSLPDDDLEVIHLLRHGLEVRDAKYITVVTARENDAMHSRYISLFGREIDWQPIGFLERMKAQGQATAAIA